MKRSSFQIFAGICTVVILVGLLAACATSDFNQPASMPAVEEALVNQGLQVCASQEIPAALANNIAAGKVYELDTDCSEYDPNQPGARVWLVEYTSAEARNAALRRFTSENRRHLGAAYAWTHGPFVIAVDGPQTPEVLAAVKQALLGLGAR